MIKLDKIRLNVFPYYEDFIDRLSYQFSIILLLITIIVVEITQFVGQTIHCFTPQEFTKSWDEYTKSYCYSLGNDNSLKNTRNKTMVISNHETISSMLFTQALFIFMNYMLWRLLIFKSEINLQRIMEAADERFNFEKRIKFISSQIDNSLKIKRIYGSSLLWRLMSYVYSGCCVRNYRIYLSFVHIIIKILYLFNVVGQLYLMKRFIGTSYSFYGFQVLYDAVKSSKWSSSAKFPNKIICDLEIKKLGRNYLYTIQCELPINMFLEKICIFLWFWFIIIGCLSTINLIRWLNELINRKHRKRFIKEYLQLMEFEQITDETYERKFIFDYIKSDGYLIIKLISINISDIVATDVIKNLWDFYSKNNRNEREQFKIDDENRFI